MTDRAKHLDDGVSEVARTRLSPGRRAYEKRRNERKHEARKKTLSASRVSLRLVVAEGKHLETPPHWRPQTRGDCLSVPRPCPFVSCKHHLYLDVHRNGSLILNFPDLEPDELPVTCALDVADGGAVTLEVAAELMNLTRERIRQLEIIAFDKLDPKLREQLDDEDLERNRVRRGF
jgi:hypothetical protein